MKTFISTLLALVSIVSSVLIGADLGTQDNTASKPVVCQVTDTACLSSNGDILVQDGSDNYRHKILSVEKVNIGAAADYVKFECADDFVLFVGEETTVSLDGSNVCVDLAEVDRGIISK